MIKLNALARSLRNAAVAGLGMVALTTPGFAADPIKVGFSMALTGPVSPNGKQLLLPLELWRDDVNAKGGLLGRPVDAPPEDDKMGRAFDLLTSAADTGFAPAAVPMHRFFKQTRPQARPARPSTSGIDLGDEPAY